jgi:DNA mismatch repair ATPase MutS
LKELSKKFEVEEEQQKQGVTQKFIILKENFILLESIFRKIIDCGAYLDCINSIKEYFNRLPGPKCFPEILPSGHMVDFDELRHPLFDPKSFVPFSLSLNGQDTNFFLLTGPNMGGKSTLLKTIMISVLMAHIGLPVTAKTARMNFMHGVIIRLGSSDDIIGGQSTFFKELFDIRDCFTKKGPLFLVFDEIGSGTSSRDGVALSISIINYLKCLNNSLGIISTHYSQLHQYLGDQKSTPKSMEFMIDKNDKIFFTYRVKDGTSAKSFASNIVRMSGIEDQVIPFENKKNQNQNIRSMERLHKVRLGLINWFNHLLITPNCN